MSCFDCHANGHTNASTHLVGDIRPQEFRRRIDTPTLRGVNQQRLFGSQRALRRRGGLHRVRAARGVLRRRHPVIAQKKGVNILERGSEVHAMAEFQELLDFPPAPKLDAVRAARPATWRPRRSCAASRCSSARDAARSATRRRSSATTSCTTSRPSASTTPALVNGRRMSDGGGPIKTFPLRGIKDSPPYLHDDRLLDARRHRRVLQPGAPAQAHRRGEERPGPLPLRTVRPAARFYTPE